MHLRRRLARRVLMCYHSDRGTLQGEIMSNVLPRTRLLKSPAWASKKLPLLSGWRLVQREFLCFSHSHSMTESPGSIGHMQSGRAWWLRQQRGQAQASYENQGHAAMSGGACVSLCMVVWIYSPKACECVRLPRWPRYLPRVVLSNSESVKQTKHMTKPQPC